MASSSQDQIFISYCRKDKRWLDDLHTHLQPYLRDGSLSAWSDEQIEPGSRWLEEIRAALAKTKVAVLLVTPDFLASDFIHENELTPILKEAESGGVIILWIHVRASAYKKSPLRNYQAVIDPIKPLAQMKADRDATWVKICEVIDKTINPR
ncbi:MAG: toll/interleukin-1 receptor domain-containing protein [Pirellulales bacterium]|nr:toll/interleukin-1 receptor domain-containing protein [Pirellulales bacterium]